MKTNSVAISVFSPNRIRGQVSRQMVTTVALVLIITSSVAFNWSMIFGGERTPPEVFEMGFNCLSCDHQFTITNKEFQARRVDMAYINKNPGLAMDMVDCPKCEKQHSATQQLKCPSCSKYFLPAKTNIRSASLAGKLPDPVCPHCGTDMNQWHRENNP